LASNGVMLAPVGFLNNLPPNKHAHYTVVDKLAY